MTIEATLAALLREQRETNALLRRLVEAKGGQPAPSALDEYRKAVPASPTSPMPDYLRRWVPPVTPCDPVLPNHPWIAPLTTCESPVTTGDGGTHRVGWQGNRMVGP